VTFTYDDPSTSTRDAIRFEIGDTDADSMLITDEEIAYCIGKEATLEGQIARACEAIGAKFTREAAQAVGGEAQVVFFSRASEWNRKAKMYRSRAAAKHAPSAGGLSLDDKAAAADDTDNPEYFRTGMMTND
jgi:hypothetical protein